MSDVYRNITGVINETLGSAIESVAMPTGVACKFVCIQVQKGQAEARIMAGSGAGDSYFTVGSGADRLVLSLMKEGGEFLFYACAEDSASELEVLLFD